VPITTAEVKLLLGGERRRIDAATKLLSPALAARLRIHGIQPGIGAAEENHPFADYRRSPDFSRSSRLPDLRPGTAIHSVHFSVVAAEECFVAAKRRRGMNLAGGLKFPFRSAMLRTVGAESPSHARHEQDS